MEQKPLTLARLAGEVGLKIRRGAARVMPWQEKLLRPVLERMKADKSYRRDIEAQDLDQYEFKPYWYGEAGRLGFSNREMERQLKPIRDRMDDESDDVG